MLLTSLFVWWCPVDTLPQDLEDPTLGSTDTILTQLREDLMSDLIFIYRLYQLLGRHIRDLLKYINVLPNPLHAIVTFAFIELLLGDTRYIILNIFWEVVAGTAHKTPEVDSVELCVLILSTSLPSMLSAG